MISDDVVSIRCKTGIKKVVCFQNVAIFAKKYSMRQTAFTVRMDADVKKRFDDLCKDFGMSANTAFNMFARAVIRQERLPFEVESEKQTKLQRAWEAVERMRASALANGIADMSMEEIDEEIRQYREERRLKRLEGMEK